MVVVVEVEVVEVVEVAAVVEVVEVVEVVDVVEEVGGSEVGGVVTVVVDGGGVVTVAVVATPVDAVVKTPDPSPEAHAPASRAKTMRRDTILTRGSSAAGAAC